MFHQKMHQRVAKVKVVSVPRVVPSSLFPVSSVQVSLIAISYFISSDVTVYWKVFVSVVKVSHPESSTTNSNNVTESSIQMSVQTVQETAKRPLKTLWLQLPQKTGKVSIKTGLITIVLVTLRSFSALVCS